MSNYVNFLWQVEKGNKTNKERTWFATRAPVFASSAPPDSNKGIAQHVVTFLLVRDSTNNECVTGRC